MIGLDSAGNPAFHFAPGVAAMTPTDMYKAGSLRGAIDAQIQDVKAHPADNGKRLFLFELCAFAGDWDRARRQVDAIQYGNPELDAAVATYRKLLDGEEARAKVFRDGVMPQFLASPPEWVYPRLEAVAALKAGDVAKAAAGIAASDAAADSITATVNGTSIESVRDCDDRFGPILEVLAHGDYYWLPMSQIESLTALPPKFPRDLVWFPAKLSIKDGPTGDVFLPALYPGTAASENDSFRLGRGTDWLGEGGPVRGVGLRLLLAGEEALPLPELREWLAS
jgi:type VI secretion system protein ImpE